MRNCKRDCENFVILQINPDPLFGYNIYQYASSNTRTASLNNID